MASLRVPSPLVSAASVAAVTVLALGLAWPQAASTARYVDAADARADLSTEILDPSTALAATVSGATVTLTWVPSPDAARASGYALFRSTVATGPFGQVGTVTPGTAATMTDAPGPGTFFYLLRTTAGTTWSSVDSNVATATVTSVIRTDPKVCTSQAPEAGGDGNGYEVDPAAACLEDGILAADIDSGTGGGASCKHADKDAHRFSGYTFGLPASVSSIVDVTLGLRMRAEPTKGGIRRVCVQLSWDGGTSWTTSRNVDITEASLTTYTASGLWGRTWAPADLADTAFVVRIVDLSNSSTRDFYLDSVSVDVGYTP